MVGNYLFKSYLGDSSFFEVFKLFLVYIFFPFLLLLLHVFNEKQEKKYKNAKNKYMFLRKIFLFPFGYPLIISLILIFFIYLGITKAFVFDLQERAEILDKIDNQTKINLNLSQQNIIKEIEKNKNGTDKKLDELEKLILSLNKSLGN